MFITRISRRSKKALLGATGVAAFALAATPALAAPPTGIYSDFTQCPTGTPNVTSCIVSDTTGGSIKLGNQTVPINKRIRLQGGFSNEADGSNQFYPAVNGQTLERTALNVPGGLLGITSPAVLPTPIRQLLQAAIDSVNGVKATAELVGPVGFSFNNLLSVEGTAVTLPIRVKLDNPFLGNNCYVGSAASPITLKLTTGTTTPPAGTAPISGDPGVVDFQDEARLITDDNLSLVDNAWSAPKANGCGGLVSPLIDLAVNAKIGLPSAAGKNVAIFNGDAKIGDAAAVDASRN